MIKIMMTLKTALKYKKPLKILRNNEQTFLDYILSHFLYNF